MSGDNQPAAIELCNKLGITDVRGSLRPEEKLDELQRRQTDERPTIVVGDGVNDAPMLAQAYVSVAVNEASDLAKRRSDLLLLIDDLNERLFKGDA